MATIINKSDIQLSIVGVLPGSDGPEQYRYRLPRSFPDKRSPRVEVPDNHARHWVKRSKADKRGLVMVQYAPSVTTNAKPKAKAKVEAPTETETPEAADTVPNGVSLAGMHWKSAVSVVSEVSDLDTLAAMHETEERPRVLEAIEDRMVELRG